MNNPIETASGTVLTLNQVEAFFPIRNHPSRNKIKENPIVLDSGNKTDLNNRKSEFADAKPIIISKKPATRLTVMPIDSIVLIDSVLFFIFTYYYDKVSIFNLSCKINFFNSKSFLTFPRFPNPYGL